MLLVAHEHAPSARAFVHHEPSPRSRTSRSNAGASRRERSARLDARLVAPGNPAPQPSGFFFKNLITDARVQTAGTSNDREPSALQQNHSRRRLERSGRSDEIRIDDHECVEHRCCPRARFLQVRSMFGLKKPPPWGVGARARAVECVSGRVPRLLPVCSRTQSRAAGHHNRQRGQERSRRTVRCGSGRSRSQTGRVARERARGLVALRPRGREVPSAKRCSCLIRRT